MAKSINVQYYPDATATCSNCGSVYTLGMTIPNLSLEICGNCHPFYSGQEVFIDTAGRIEKFTARQAKAINASTKATKQKKVRKLRYSLMTLGFDNQETQIPAASTEPSSE